MEYESIFRHRGQSYDLAMKQYPNVRDLEFEQLFSKIPLREKETILDVPSLGGYLKKYCLDDTKVIFLDFSESINNIKIVSPYEKWEIPRVDRIVCLASIHHIDNLSEFLNNLKIHLLPGGILHLADVSITNPIAKFLDVFVGSNTSTGKHEGFYYDWSKIKFSEELEVISLEDRNCPWIFQSEVEMAEYCRLLFDLKNTTNKEILDSLKKHVGYEKVKNKISLNWFLTYIDLRLNS